MKALTRWFLIAALGVLPMTSFGQYNTVTHTAQTQFYPQLPNDSVYEIMRISRDAANWSQNIPYQVTVRSAYYTSGGIVTAQIHYGFNDSGSVNVTEAQGVGMMAPVLGAEVHVSGSIYYRPVQVYVPAYMVANIEVLYNTVVTSVAPTAAGQVQFTGTQTSASGGGLYDGTVNFAGNVGIGTNAPAGSLDVAGQISYFGTAAGGTRLNARGPLSGAGLWLQYTDGNSYYDSAQNTYIRTGGGTGLVAMTLLSNGNVGIGTTVPPYSLSVKGTIGAGEVVVTSTSGWPDYVFEPGYRLADLSEVAAFVKENHHLPDVPSAAEVQEKGVGLGEMQTKLLAKVEELTLHMIAAEERSQRLERENEELRRSAAEMRVRVERVELAAGQ